ncbi:T-lymphocyte activation antigen CD86 [Gossypium arboreum]|uniref:T-lymphocyte activation antigen CD86 n=1 Tax=Gossypium arboreum TaxID=29729 RepID=A0A0B0PMY5_GOSAR|nr:T-lymphocyte activation antigen CD86 [Gossypium arboreum]
MNISHYSRLNTKSGIYPEPTHLAKLILTQNISLIPYTCHIQKYKSNYTECFD